MKLYLSSYKFGDHPEKLAELYGTNKKVAVISNALDFSNDQERLATSQKEQLDGLNALGLDPIIVDLKKYFGKKDELEKIILECGGVWVRGGNTFVLRVAYKLSGFDEIVRDLAKNNPDFVYGGFSAGGCVLQKNLKGIDFVDDPSLVKTTYNEEVVWEGVGLLDYVFVPHFESDHPESDATNVEIEYYKANNIAYKTLRDGEVIVSST